jgi:hypothetical protein
MAVPAASQKFEKQRGWDVKRNDRIQDRELHSLAVPLPKKENRRLFPKRLARPEFRGE